MELELNSKIEEHTVSNDSIISEFTKELSKTLETKDIFVYKKPIDDGEFTDENLVKIEEEYRNTINSFINLQEEANNTIYEVIEIGKNYDLVREYNAKTEEIVDYQLSKGELPKECKKGMILHKEDGYVIDKEMTQELYYKMKEYETKLFNEQEKYLKKMRKNGELYYVKNVERRLQVLEDRT